MSKRIAKIEATSVIPNTYVDNSRPLEVNVYASRSQVELVTNHVNLLPGTARLLGYSLIRAADEADRMEDAHAADPSETEEPDQKRIDTDRTKMADEIVAGQNLTNLEDAKRFARNWITTAAQHAANEEYFRGERDRIQIERADDQATIKELEAERANLHARIACLEVDLAAR